MKLLTNFKPNRDQEYDLLYFNQAIQDKEFLKSILEISRIFYNSKFNEALTIEMFVNDLSYFDKISEFKNFINNIFNLSKSFYNFEFMNAPVNDVNLVDCDRLPRIPQGWVLKNHILRGVFDLKNESIKLYENGSGLSNKELKEGKRDLNATMLDHFLRFPETIPAKWKEKMNGSFETPLVIFYGTSYDVPSSGIIGTTYRFITWSLEKQIWKTGYVICMHTNPWGLNGEQYRIKILKTEYVNLFD